MKKKEKRKQVEEKNKGWKQSSIPILDFSREIIVALLKSRRTPRVKPGPKYHKKNDQFMMGEQKFSDDVIALCAKIPSKVLQNW